MSFVRSTRRLSALVGAAVIGNWISNVSDRRSRKFLGVEMRRFSQWFLLQPAMIDFFWASENYAALASLLRAEAGNFQVQWEILGRARSEEEMALLDSGEKLQHKIISALKNEISVHPSELVSLARSPSPFWAHLACQVDRKFLTQEFFEQICREMLQRRSEKIFDFLKAADEFVLSPAESEICWKLFPHRRRELLQLHFSRGGRVHGNFLLQVISDPRLPVPGYVCAETASFLSALVERSEISLGLTDARVRAYAEHLAQTLEEDPEIISEKFPIILSHEELLRRVEIITDSLAPTHPLAEIFRLLKPQFADSPKISANIAALGPSRSKRKFVGTEISRRSEISTRQGWNEKVSRLPHGPRLLEGLEPMFWPEKKFPTAVVVLVHGLRGGERTWRFADEAGTAWPGVLLPEKFPEISVFSFSFDAPLWSVEHQERYTEISVPRRIEAISDRLKTRLEAAGLDKFPCIFVCHSMGGLVVKHLLVNDRKFEKISRGVVFFSTPHLGSPIADFASNLLTPPFVAELSRKDRNLLLLNDRFVALKIPTLNFFETATTDIGPGIKTLVVSRASAEAAGGISVSAGERMDHVQCCKLPRHAAQQDMRVRTLLEFLSANYS